ncbi:dephospho-CoA kinase [Actinoplanes sp. TFC3]|uniref:dephospho-CoA kinase n=1 Tax=Actinoplanes sp. TFC3 TaxID=1710355 RepID=UPI000835AE85|nr:dephospho-CoA kinase [Actinoplanes sp. TFC3]
MLMVGLTGGIGAGKSAVARRLRQLGAVIIDSDVLAREVVAAGTEGLAAVVETFGPQVLGADGHLNRPALGAIVFQDEQARRRLEEIIHPRVRSRSRELVAAAPPAAIVVNDVPLLVETGQAPSYHLVLVVSAAEPVRIERLVRTRGMTEEQAAARIAAQASDEQRQAAADVVLDNTGSLAGLHAAVDALWERRLWPYEENVRLRRVAGTDGVLRLAGPDPRWPGQAERLAARIRHALGGTADVSHIGSTAVPGLIAKDVIDLMLTVASLNEADQLADALAGAGFPPKDGDRFDNARGQVGKMWTKRLHGSADPGRPVNLHVRVKGSPGWRFALHMRDQLRADDAAREAYAAAKRGWAAEHADVAGYAQAKEPWFDEWAGAHPV